jgi:hypothetical protein
MPYNETTGEWEFNEAEEKTLENAFLDYIKNNNLKPGNEITKFEIDHGVTDVAFLK